MQHLPKVLGLILFNAALIVSFNKTIELRFMFLTLLSKMDQVLNLWCYDVESKVAIILMMKIIGFGKYFNFPARWCS